MKHWKFFLVIFYWKNYHSTMRCGLSKKKWPKWWLKVAFFQKVYWNFSDLQISEKKYSRKLFWNLNFKLKDSFLDFFFFLRFGDLKNKIALSEKKPPLAILPCGQSPKENIIIIKKSSLCWGIEPRSPAWQAGILTTILIKIGKKWRKKLSITP